MTTGQDESNTRRSLRGLPGGVSSTQLLEHAQDLVALLVGVVLVLLAVTVLAAGVVDFFHQVNNKSVATAGEGPLDRVLLVLILTEIVHTVVLSLRAHSLVAQPFIVVGLVAVIRRILFILSNAISISTAQFAVLMEMVVVFMGGRCVIYRSGSTSSATVYLASDRIDCGKGT